jgi:hypothetical protein
MAGRFLPPQVAGQEKVTEKSPSVARARGVRITLTRPRNSARSLDPGPASPGQPASFRPKDLQGQSPFEPVRTAPASVRPPGWPVRGPNRARDHRPLETHSESHSRPPAFRPGTPSGGEGSAVLAGARLRGSSLPGPGREGPARTFWRGLP